MATVRVGSARSSFGDTTRGDQNGGKEVSTQAWYKHSLGWVMLRAKDDAKLAKIGQLMENACNNDLIGYSQEDRDSLYSAVKDKGFDPGKCTKPANTDCSACVRVCVNGAGITVGNIRTSDMVDKLTATGAFTKYTSAKYTESSEYLRRGDILVTKVKGHTVVVLDDGPKAEKSADGKKLTINNGTYYVRKTPTTKESNYIMIGAKALTVHSGDVVDLLGTEDGWYKIKHKGYTGYVSGKAVK